LARHTNTQRNKPVCAGPGELCRQKQFASWVAPFGQPCPAPVLEALSVARSCQGLFVERTPFRKKQSGNDSSSMFSAAACANCVRQSIKDTANINHPALASVHAYATAPCEVWLTSPDFFRTNSTLSRTESLARTESFGSILSKPE
jgi:hypothetical protein